MQKKIDVISNAYRELRISGLTVEPSPEDLAAALTVLEIMMAELNARNIITGYNFTQEPDPSDLTNVDIKFHQMMNTNLAIRLIASFNKNPSPQLQSQANQSLSSASSFSASDRINQVQYPNRMSEGSGNRRYTRGFMHIHQLPPNEPKTNYIGKDEINDFSESFESYLRKGETITLLEVTGECLDILSSSIDDSIIRYRVKSSSIAPIMEVRIKITTSTGRIEIRHILFGIEYA